MGRVNLKPLWLVGIAAFAAGFGLMTVYSGGSVLFIDGEARRNAGNYVPFVLWFNFLTGFAYIAAAYGMVMRYRYVVGLSILITGSTLTVFAAFGYFIIMGGEFETRTVVAMTLRSFVWVAIALTLSMTGVITRAETSRVKVSDVCKEVRRGP